MIYIFGNCIFDVQLYALYRADTCITLGPKAFNVLNYLIRNRDRVVSKQELCNLLWPDQTVGDAALAKCIAYLRKAVNDTGTTQQIIQTFYGHGYRFIATVEESSDAPPTGRLSAVSSSLFPPLDQVPAPIAVYPAGPSTSLNRVGLRQCEPAQLELDGEPREVTVLCGALAHTEGLITHLAPEALQRLISEFFEQVHGEVQYCGGTVRAFLDDSFTALFGVSVPCDTHAQQAVWAALRLQQSLYKQSAVQDGPRKTVVKVRLGMHTGLVVGRRLGDDRRLTYTAVGDTLRLAMRLQQLAEPGTLLLSEVTARRVQEVRGIGRGGPVSIVL